MVIRLEEPVGYPLRYDPIVINRFPTANRGPDIYRVYMLHSFPSMPIHLAWHFKHDMVCGILMIFTVKHEGLMVDQHAYIISKALLLSLPSGRLILRRRFRSKSELRRD